jgi:hypothetical protein
MPEFPIDLTLNSALAGVAALLLVFVSGGVVYLSAMEWKDKRRRAAVSSPRAPRRSNKN